MGPCGFQLFRLWLGCIFPERPPPPPTKELPYPISHAVNHGDFATTSLL